MKLIPLEKFPVVCLFMLKNDRVWTQQKEKEYFKI